MKKFLRFSIAALLVGWLSWSGHLDWQRIASVQLNGFLLLLVLFRLTLTMLPSLRWSMLINARGVHIGPRRAIRAGFVGQFAGLGLPSSLGTDGTRFFYARQAGADVATIVASIVADRVIGSLALGTLVLGFGLAFLPPFFQQTLLVIAAVGVGACAAGLVVMLWRPTTGWVRTIHDAFYAYRGHPVVLLKAYALSLFAHLLAIVASWCAFQALKIDVAVKTVAGAFPLVSLSREFSFTPMGLGVVETVAHAVYSMMSIDGGADVSMLTRIVYLVVAISIGGAVFLIPQKEHPRVAE